MIDIPVEGSRKATVRSRVEDLYGAKVGTHHWNILMDTWKYELEYDDWNHYR